MSYLFTTPAQQQEMLDVIGASSIGNLFDPIPDELRLKRDLNLPAPLTELELEAEITARATQNQQGTGLTSFLGGGVADHFIPAAVDEIASRGEYYTAYTPYQAEASQGSLQVFFEYQTLICQLLGMDVSNASLYEGGTAITEAAFMAQRVTRRNDKIVVLRSVHPEYRQVLKTYFDQLNCEIVEVGTPDGTVDPNLLEDAIDESTACVIVQTPNFYGCLEDVPTIAECAHRHGALLVASCDPISLGMLKRPGEMGVDIATAEGQPLGIPMQYGGPFLGILACREEYMRKMPGRVIGTTSDRLGSSCFVLNLQAREQHIRRDKATSNICTNQGLLAIRATVYLSLLGPNGLKEAADLCFQHSHYAAEKLTSIPGLELAFDRPFFKEFTLKYAGDARELCDKAARGGFSIGPRFDQFPGLVAPDLESSLLISVTEKRTPAEIDRLAETLAS